MAGPDTIPDLHLTRPDGTPLSRIEAEQKVRETWPKVHWRRIMANKHFGLSKQHSFGLKEVMLLHWYLDEAVRRGLVVGNQVGVDLQNYNDENEQRQFAQRLAAMIQGGESLQPKEGEGIDMSNVPQPPIGTPQNGQAPQPGFVPPPPPMGMAPQPGYAPPQAPPQMPPQPGFVPQQPQAAQPMMQPQQGFVPPGAPPQFAPPQPAYAPPPAPQGFAPPQAAPMMPPGYAPQPGAPQPMMAPPPMPGPGAPPQAPPQQASGGRRGRGKSDQAAAPAPTAAPVPAMPQGNPGFAPLPPQQPFQPMVPQAAPMPQAAAGPQLDLSALTQRLDQLTQQLAFQGRQLAMSNMALTILSRAVYSKQGSSDLESWLKELGIPLPQ